MLRSMSRVAELRGARVSRPRWIAIMCAGALAVGAFGPGSTPAFAKQSKPTITAAKVTGVGTILVDSKGRTVYTLTNAGQAVPCSAECLGVWPAVLVKAGSKPKGGRGVTKLGVMSGGNQVTQNGLPLYRFAGDSKAGQANGEGISSFGGVWHVVKTSGGTSSPTPTTAKKSSSSGGYGY
jgi:predicted lipoprotein with Yx(FWY)xxD motif